MTINLDIAQPPPHLHAAYLKSKHEAGLDYDAYLATDPGKADHWNLIESQLHLNDEQRSLIAGFTRVMRVLCISGIWCGDCVAQCPMLRVFEHVNPGCIDLKFLDRDQHLDLAEHVPINAGLRVPVVIFMAEDFHPVSILGDRTLTRYRALAARKLGSSCPLPGAPIPKDELAATMQEWLDEFERVHLLLRLSARLREKHGD